MITTLILLCLSLLDIQQMPPVSDSPEKQFTVTELWEQALTGCTSSPQAGRPSNHQIFIDVVNNNDPHEGATPVSALSASNYNAVMESPNVPAITPHNPPGVPDPNPETPPVASTPEPPTVAILGISLGALMYLLFGRNRQKLYRRRS